MQTTRALLTISCVALSAMTACGSGAELDDQLSDELVTGFARITSAYGPMLEACLATSAVAETTVDAAYCANSHPGQGWKYTTAHQLLSQHAGTGRCIANGAGQGARMMPCSATDPLQKWTWGPVVTIGETRGRRLTNNGNGLCLTAQDGAAPTLEDCAARPRQLWGLTNAPTTELNIPAATMPRPTGLLRRFASTPMTRAATGGQIQAWELYPATDMNTTLGAPYKCSPFGVPGGSSTANLKFITAGGVIAGFDASNRVRVKYSFSTFYNECALTRRHHAVRQRVIYGDGSGDEGLTIYHDQGGCGGLSGPACQPPKVVSDPLGGYATTRLLQLLSHDLAVAPLPTAAVADFVRAARQSAANAADAEVVELPEVVVTANPDDIYFGVACYSPAGFAMTTPDRKCSGQGSVRANGDFCKWLVVHDSDGDKWCVQQCCDSSF